MKLYILVTNFILSRIPDTAQSLEYAIKFGYLNNDLSPRRCYKCFSKNYTEKVVDYIDMRPIEIEAVCECGAVIGYWYAGSWCV